MHIKNFVTRYLCSYKNLLTLSLIFSIVILGSALVSQYIFGLQPCQLCLWQRIPYKILIPLLFLSLFLKPLFQKYICYLTVLIFAVSAAIALFHVGVEQTWWQGLASCSQATIPENASLEDLRAILTRQPIVPCDKIAFAFLGISMAGYNFIISFIMAVFVFMMTQSISRHHLKN